MDLWTALLDILILLTAAMVLGGLCERFRQSPILGYLLAGTLLGPNALDLLPSHAAVTTIAELGIALLLFTIGLEFSWRTLRAVGHTALGGGTLQVLLTGALTAVVCLMLGLGPRASVAVGAMIALSSTAAVLRLLANRAEIDAVHGRNAVGILLLQDIAVVPLVLVIAALGGGGSAGQIGWAIARAVGLAALLVGALHLLLNYGLPLLLSARVAARNRDLPILLAIVTAVGAAWVSHALGFSPVLGAFIAGMLLAESPYATQIRADIVPLRTLFVTLFFSSIGMLSNPAWVADNWMLLAAVVAAIVVGKAVVTSGVVRLFRSPLGQSLATGIVLAQVGEFSLVVAVAAQEGRLIGVELFDLIVASLTITLFLTPYLVALGPRLATVVGRLSTPDGAAAGALGEEPIPPAVSGHLVIVGFGPAGQRVAEVMMGEHNLQILVVELNPHTADHALAYGLQTYLGDATREEVLERVHVGTAAAVVITVPDPGTARQIVQRVRASAPNTSIIVRARYHVHRWQLDVAGAHTVVDEEDEVGVRIAAAVRRRLRDIGLGGES
ncbi:MAG: sodium:proton exchanger [Gemmatimonadales bacterium]|nr:sodium:proton exchanger [Gemmatimonadales bacterium]NIN13172.1 sodium:proton exchanger [Gemmatimonadales bacterium]NIN51450.1 sodium:proton exchanger [Gemmatimonadales bacterium]NIP08914.1 sodium:proton exchanger [Gemmatimonadales bacterium]NIR03702.1 sodium:proton exchanger [Gemmatimonadales bacterium]